MELSPLQFLVFLGVPLLLGSSLLRWLGIGPRTDPLAWAGWTWMAGAVSVAALEVLRLGAGLPSPGTVVVLAVLLAAVLRFAARRTPVLADPERGAGEGGTGEGGAAESAGSGRIERVFFGLALALVLAVTVHRILAGSLSAVVAGDEANFWSRRAKFLFEAQGFSGLYAQAVRVREFNNATYPLQNSLLQLWVFDCAGAITDAANRLPMQLTTLSLVLCAASAFRRASRPWIAALLLLLLTTCAPVEAWVRRAESDSLVAFSALVAADVLRRAARARHAAWLGLGSLAVTFLVWSKREGVLLVLVSAVAFALCAWWRGEPCRGELRRGELRRQALPLRALPWLCLPLLVQLGTMLHNAWLGARGSHRFELSVLTGTWEHIGDLPEVLAHLARLTTRPHLAAIPAVFALLAVLVSVRRSPEARRPGGVLSFVPLACLIFLVFLIFALVQRDYRTLIHQACTRVVSQFLPLQCLWIALVAREIFARWREVVRRAGASG